MTTNQQSNEQPGDKFLAQMRLGATLCHEVEKIFGVNPPPEVETLIKAFRALVMTFCSRAEAEPKLIGSINDLMKPVLAWVELEEKKRQRELVEQKQRLEEAEREAARARGKGGIQPETYESVEKNLKLA
jgi:hypothetical protein